MESEAHASLTESQASLSLKRKSPSGCELGVMKKIELKKRARTAGITQDELDEAGEAEDEAAAVIELILARMRQEGYKQDL